MAEKKNKTIEEASKEMDYLTGDEAVRRLAELKEKWEHDYADTKECGRKEGRQEAIKERNIQVVKEMKKNNLSIDVIQKVTGLSKEEIENIE